MSYQVEVENLLHQAHMDQLQGNIQGCLSKQIQAMSILDVAKKDCIEEEAALIATRLNNIAAEFNMIRQLNPTVEVQVQREEVNEEPAETEIPEMSSSTMGQGQPQVQGEEVPPIASEQTQSQQESTPSFAAAVDKTFNEIRAYANQMNEKYHIADELRESYDKGVNNVKEFFADGHASKHFKEGCDSAVQWFKESRVIEKTAEGAKFVISFIVKGILVGTQYVTEGVMNLISKNTVTQNDNIVAPTPQGIVAENVSVESSSAVSFASEAGSSENVSSSAPATDGPAPTQEIKGGNVSV